MNRQMKELNAFVGECWRQFGLFTRGRDNAVALISHHFHERQSRSNQVETSPRDVHGSLHGKPTSRQCSKTTMCCNVAKCPLQPQCYCS